MNTNTSGVMSYVILAVAIVVAGYFISSSLSPIAKSAEKIAASIDTQTQNAAVDGCYQAARISYQNEAGETISTPENTWVQNCLNEKRNSK